MEIATIEIVRISSHRATGLTGADYPIMTVIHTTVDQTNTDQITIVTALSGIVIEIEPDSVSGS